MRKLSLITLFVVVLLAGCERRPFQKPVWVDIQPNCDVYVQPVTLGVADGASDKVKRDETAKILTAEEKKAARLEGVRKTQRMLKRINIPTDWQSLGRMHNDGKWTPTVKVVQVDMSIVTREWTHTSTSGTSASDQALGLESKDSVNFKLPCLVMALLYDSALFKSEFGEITLAEALDRNVRPLYVSAGTAVFKQWDGGRDLETNKVKAMAEINELVVPQVKPWGIDILVFGLIGGPVYEEKSDIQKGMDNNFISQMNALVEEEKNTAQEKRNEITVQTAKAEAKAAEAIYAVKQAQEQRVLMETAVIRAKAALSAAQNWDGVLPRVMPASMVDMIPLLQPEAPPMVDLSPVSPVASPQENPDATKPPTVTAAVKS